MAKKPFLLVILGILVVTSIGLFSISIWDEYLGKSKDSGSSGVSSLRREFKDFDLAKHASSDPPTYCDQVNQPGNKIDPRKYYRSFTSMSEDHSLESILDSRGWVEAQPVKGMRYVKSVDRMVNCTYWGDYLQPYKNPDPTARRLWCAPTDVGLFHIAYADYHREDTPVKYGQEFGCPGSQMVSKVEGRKYFSDKSQTARAISKYAQHLRFAGKLEQCFPEYDLIPKSWLLKEPKECEMFFDMYINQDPSGSIEYLVKLASVHRGDGVYALTPDVVIPEFDAYMLGAKCSDSDSLENVIMQSYVSNPFLIEGHKTDCRLYSVLGSTDPPIASMSREFYTRKAGSEYSNTGTANSIALTHMKYTRAIIDVSTDELFAQADRDYLFTVPMFVDYLNKNYPDQSGEATLEKILNKVRHTMLHITLAIMPRLGKRRRNYNMFGWDFILDENFDPHFIEANANPDLWHPGAAEELRMSVGQGIADFTEQILDKSSEEPLDDLHTDWLTPVFDFSRDDFSSGLLSDECEGVIRDYVENFKED